MIFVEVSPYSMLRPNHSHGHGRGHGHSHGERPKIVHLRRNMRVWNGKIFLILDLILQYKNKKWPRPSVKDRFSY